MKSKMIIGLPVPVVEELDFARPVEAIKLSGLAERHVGLATVPGHVIDASVQAKNM